MLLIDAQLTASEVLRTFRRDEPYLFLGAAFSTVALVAAGFCVLRRRFDPLLICLAAFAFIYGQRLWLQADLLRITVPDNQFFDRLRIAINYLVPIPGFIYFQVAGFLGKRGKIAIAVPITLFLSLVAGTFLFGPLPIFHTINNGLVISTMWALALTTWKRRKGDRDYSVVRWGLLVFVVLALWDNMVEGTWVPKVEPYGFAVFLGCLGYVTARRAVDREAQLGEIEKELELARRIQRSILPAALPDSASFRVAARYVPMTSVAGDLYEFIVANENEMGLLIADVSGHGVPAALIASMVKMAATTQRPNSADPARLLEGMNSALCGNTQNEYVTAAYVYLNARTGELRYAAAGHPPMLLARGGEISEISENGMLLAALEGAVFTATTRRLVAGDRLALYTDGIIEARNREGRMFGDEALQLAVLETAALPPGEAADQIVARAQAWAKSQDDDLTLLVCDFLGRDTTASSAQ